MFGSLATICIYFIRTSGIFLCVIILDKLCNLECFPQHGDVTRPWLGSLKARCSFKKKEIKTQTKTENPLLSTAYNFMSDRTVLRAFPLDSWS